MKNYFFVLLFTLILASCTPQKKVVYFQGKLPETITKTEGSSQFSEIKLQSGDIISVQIQAVNMESFSFLAGQSEMKQMNDTRSAYERGYVLDTEGIIEMPLVGKIKLAGLTIVEGREEIKKKFKVYIEEPVIIVKRLDFRITVLGEVSRPGTYTFNQERITFPEAIGIAGDLTPYANRTKVKLIRIFNNDIRSYEIDLTNNKLFSEELYYLKPNDMIYVEPVKRKNFANTHPSLSIISF
jgi:polysaccharide biosynthesis/export protein